MTPTSNTTAALGQQLQLLQLRAQPTHPHALDPAYQPASPRRLGSQSRRSLAYTLLLAPQHPLHHALHPHRRNHEYWPHHPSLDVFMAAGQQHHAVYLGALRRNLRC